MKFDCSSEGFKRKLSSNIFACNLIIEWPRKEWGNFNLKDLNKEMRRPGLKFNTGLALIGLQTTGR